jgi:hypothetical protein
MKRSKIGAGPAAWISQVVLLFACSSTPPPASPLATTSGTPTPVPNATQGVGRSCETKDLSISVTNTSAGAGNVGGYLRFVNSSKLPCSIQGAPSLTALTAAGAATAARVSATVGTPFPSLAEPPLIILSPGADAFAAYGGSDIPADDSSTCPPPYRTFHVAPPGSSSGVDLRAFNVWLNQDQPSCAGIAVTVIASAVEVNQYTDLSSLRP